MEIKNAAISILINENYTTIELYDEDAATQFAEVTLTPAQLSQALSRICNTKCKIEVNGLDHVGKTMKHKTFQFEIPEKYDYDNKSLIAAKYALKACPEGWESDMYFNSQNSFYKEDGKQFARCTIRRWE
jgi:hypothetical protein